MRAPTRRRAFTLIELLVVIAIIGNGITITLVEVQGNRVRVGIDAPDQVHILRAELLGWQDGPLNADLEGNDDTATAAMLTLSSSDNVATQTLRSFTAAEMGKIVGKLS